MQDVLTVSRLNAEVRQLLEKGFGSVMLVGEVSNFAAPSSGHWYFTLKDERAQVRCAMFRNANQRARVRPANGVQVMVRAKLTLYEPRGDYQLIAEHIEEAGAGLLQQRYEQLKMQLAAAGLFAQEHKQPLPENVRTLGVITSPSGAAIRDVLAVLRRRDPAMRVIIYPTAVQGERAATEIRQALATAVRRNEVDALLLTRGGGSLEDLWCFNDEALAHDIYQCPIPIISAVGHEIDFTISDFVADVRAPTPSAAAEQISQDQQQWLERIQYLNQRSQRALERYLVQIRQRQQTLQARLQQQHPQRQLLQQSQRADDALRRAQQALSYRLQHHKAQLNGLLQRLPAVHPQRELLRQQQNLKQQQQRLQQAMQRLLKQQRQRLADASRAAQLVSPLNTLDRGYAIARKDDGSVVRSAEQIASGEELELHLANGKRRIRGV
ncbi:exodeoxyribonuclease VII large subunit [Idiomarina tyrosinivorans]|uniref:Exodeoxyribonuclease 7 large subunit n=1 Tax=Idiomarina tyrosinivorans TaxID=1445662 RepID=A0A432ZQV9_9GAMM|nr:exodeoxyribonuclease VII large subunit [Idiomarina tyrosinivorans]RUO80290.1 exodeoxyribonuclease VII large subunit [Idiomarina tyrosinivorans]